MKQPLTIVGFSARAAAQSAFRGGYQVTAIDRCGDLDTIAAAQLLQAPRWPAGLLRLLQAAPPGTWLYTGGLENHPQLVDRLAQIQPLAGNRGDVLRKARSFSVLSQLAAESGLRVPATHFGSAAPPQFCDWLWKPRRSAGGIGVAPVEGPIARNGGYYQERIRGVSCSSQYLAAGGAAVLLGSTEQLSGPEWGAPGPFVYAGSLAPVVLSPEETAALQRLGQAAARLGLQGLFGVDWIRNDEGLWMLEINPRYTAACELFDRLLEESLVAWHLSACLTGELPQLVASQIAPPKLFAKAVVYARDSLHVHPLAPTALLAWRDEHGSLAADIPPAGAKFAAGQPLCTVFAAGDPRDGVLQTLRERSAVALQACRTGYFPMQ